MTAPVDDPRNYTTLALLKESLDITDTKRDMFLASKLVSAARSIDQHTGRRPGGFCLDDTATTRIYPLIRRVVSDPDGSERLLVDEIGAEVGIIVEAGTAGSDVWETVTDWEPAPDNALADGVPIFSIRRYRLPWRVYRHRFSRIRVTARWGWPEVPDVVKEATLLQATRLAKRKNSPEGVAGSADWGSIRVTRVDPDVEALLVDLTPPGVG